MILSCTFSLSIVALSAADPAAQPAIQWQPQEIRVTATDEHPWWSFPVTVDFTHQATGQRLVVEAYWDGDRQWAARFSASQPGIWTWRTSSDDAGLDGQSGRFEVRSPTEEETARNPNYRGQLRISSNHRYFQYADGTPVFLLADTLWSGNTSRCGLGQDQDGPFFQYLADRRAKGFTTVLIKYLNGFDDGPSNPKGERNEGGYAFLQRDLDRLNPSFFRALDRRMAAIWSHGFIAAIPTAWWGKTTQSVFDIQWAKRVSAYCAVRYAANNSLWCLSGEYQYTFKDCGWAEESFNDMGRTMQAHNPYGHPLSIHPSARLDWPAPHNCQSSRPFHRSDWLDHHWLQTGQSVDRMYNIVARAEENRALLPPKPVFCSEACYGASDDPDQAYHARWQAWVAMLSGCAGYGYGAHGIWQFYDAQDPEGETGKPDKRAVPWSQALRFEGSTMVQPVNCFLTRHPWWRLEPSRDRLLVEGRPAPRPTATDLTPPHCAAIPGELYVVYIPRGNTSRSVKVANVETGSYQVAWYDPRTGEEMPPFEAPVNRKPWSIPQRPSPSDEDWVLLLHKP